MLKEESEVFLQLSRESDERILHAGTATEVTGNLFTAKFKDDELDVFPEQDVAIYYVLHKKFVCRKARILNVFEDENDANLLCLDIESTSEISDAESRQSYRVPAGLAEIDVTFGGDEESRLADVSATGFAVISPHSHEIGSDVKVTTEYGGDTTTGYVRIRSKRELRNGKYRYGVHCIEPDLENHVRNICMDVQRSQLRRMAAT
jgi:hypothetical protein